jgi:hypothetical protein
MTHLFTIADNVWDSVDTPTVLRTAQALHEIGLFKFPFSKFDIQVHFTDKSVQKFFSGESSPSVNYPVKTLIFRYIVKDDDTNLYAYEVKMEDKFLDQNQLEYECGFRGLDFYTTKNLVKNMDYLSQAAATFLVVLLSTKNAEKTTEKVKKHGPKSRKRPRAYDYITTLKIGKITETCRSDGDGRGSVRPHLRRGHIRNQRVGKGLSEVKPIFIAPCFINADENWINNQRKEYRLVA